jgi:hypothetical protein
VGDSDEVHADPERLRTFSQTLTDLSAQVEALAAQSDAVVADTGRADSDIMGHNGPADAAKKLREIRDKLKADSGRVSTCAAQYDETDMCTADLILRIGRPF